MSLKERSPFSEVTPEQVYSKAREILDLHGNPGTRPTILFIRRPNGQPRGSRGEDIPITQAPILPVKIADEEYRLWLKSKDNIQPDNRNGAIKLSVHFEQLPYGLDRDRIEYDSEGYVTGYWYKPSEESELSHSKVVRSLFLPKELGFSWYIAKTYSIKPNINSSEAPANVPPEIIAGLEDSNDFLLTILEKMQTELTKLKDKSA